MSKFVLISKDAMCADYLPVYGNTNWKTPNIDSIAAQGTVFTNHYIAAPSTVMSFYSMVTGCFAHETKYEMYERIHDIYEGETLFTKLAKRGVKSHILWGPAWMPLVDYFDYFRNDVKLHSIDNFSQGVGAHFVHDGFLKPDKIKEEKTFLQVSSEVKKILCSKEDTFLWIHFPHVIYGKVAYGSDIELFDRYVGMIRNYVPDNCIAITTDHGNMNGHKGKICYGYDVYEPAIRIPLITPRIDNQERYKEATSSVDLFSILFDKFIPKREFIYSDSAYRAQKHRKLAIISNGYKYIFNKKTGVEELYDLGFDPHEKFSLMEDFVFDVDRKIQAPSRELYYYPNWDRMPEIRTKMRAEKNRIWKNGSLKVVLKSNMKDILRPFYERLTKEKMANK